MGFGSQLAKDTQERTCGTRTTGFRRAKLRSANRYAIDSACGKPAAERTGLHERPAGREDAALRPGAAAGCGAHSGAIQNSKFKIQNYHSGCSLRRTRRSEPAGRELRAFAGQSCGPLGLCKAEIQNSKFKIQN